MSIKKKVLCLALAASIASMSVFGCYGSYALTNTIHGIGKNIASGNKYVGGIVYLLLGMPVGGFCMFADWLIFNTIEFWTGTNLLAMGDTFEQTDENGNRMLATKNADGTLSMNMTDALGNKSVYIMERDGNQFRVLDANGELVAWHTVHQ